MQISAGDCASYSRQQKASVNRGPLNYFSWSWLRSGNRDGQVACGRACRQDRGQADRERATVGAGDCHVGGFDAIDPRRSRSSQRTSLS